MRSIMVLLAAAAMMAMPGLALAQPNVCVSIKGQTKIDEGASSCFSDTTSQAVAVNGSDSLALDSSHAVAVNNSLALALADCTITVQNGELNVCVF